MGRKRSLLGQELELLRAARDGRLVLSVQGRYVLLEEVGSQRIAGRPDRKVRESLVRRGYLAGPSGAKLMPYTLTELGKQALAATTVVR